MGCWQQFFGLAELFQNVIDLNHILFSNTFPTQYFDTAVALQLGYIRNFMGIHSPFCVLGQPLGEQFDWRQHYRLFRRKGLIKLINFLRVCIVYLIIDIPPTNAVQRSIIERHGHQRIKAFPVFGGNSK